MPDGSSPPGPKPAQAPGKPASPGSAPSIPVVGLPNPTPPLPAGLGTPALVARAVVPPNILALRRDLGRQAIETQ